MLPTNVRLDSSTYSRAENMIYIFSYNLVNKNVLQGTVEILTKNVGLIEKGVEAQTHQKPNEV